MIIGGIQRFSLIEYPGYISAIIFVQGCNFRCPYCYNSDLIALKPKQVITEQEFFSFLDRRVGKLEGVAITGGEPTLQPDLMDFISKIKEKGFLVKLDTNGSMPEIVEKVISSDNIDYIAMDVKAPPEKYKLVSGSDISIDKIMRSISIIKNGNIDYEFRTTAVRSLISIDDFEKIGKMIDGAKRYVIQQPQQKSTLDSRFVNEKKLTITEIDEIKQLVGKYVKEIVVRE